jgi:hypothetical protein
MTTGYGSNLLINSMLGQGGYDTTRAGIKSDMDSLKASYVPGGDARANAEVMSRISQLQSQYDNLKDVNTGYSPIGVHSATDMLKYQGGTDTVNKYLTDTLDTGYKNATDAAAQANAARGMGASTMADWGQNQMARQYATDKTGVAVQSEDYYRQLMAADEAAKTGILQAGESGLGSDAAMAAGRNSASQAQESLAQQLASYNSNLQYNYDQAKTNWQNQSNQNLYSSIGGFAKMGMGGYLGGTAGMLGMNPNFWSTGWGGTNYNPTARGNTNGDSGGVTSSSGGIGRNPAWGF